MTRRDLLFLAVVLGGVFALARAAGIGQTRAAPGRVVDVRAADAAEASIIARVDSALRPESRAKQPKAVRASDLVVMRRLALSLTGSAPSLEEIRRFEARPPADRVDSYLDQLLADRRCADYLAERFARAFVGTEGGPFILFRRRRFVAWLSDTFLENKRYDAVVRELIADRGLWTDHPATNFITVTFNPDEGRPDPERVAARVSRAFLGARIDCAQCHDHPFQPWKQADFRGLAAFFGSVRSDLRGLGDGAMFYQPPDRKTKEPTKVSPRVPALPELCPEAGAPRDRLASWVVDARNPGLARATVNRVWALLFGKPLVEPIDDLPSDDELPPALLMLASDFSSHNYDLHRLIRTIASTEAFRIESRAGNGDGTPDPGWSVFPLTRLRPEQVAGTLCQASSISAINAQSHWFIRFISFTRRNDFVKRYGDTGEDEFDTRGGTIPQRLLLMNGELMGELIKEGLFNAPSQIAALAPNDREAVESAYLCVLTRRPTPEESAHFVRKLEGTKGDARKSRVTDLFWTLLNSSESAWNH